MGQAMYAQAAQTPRDEAADEHAPTDEHSPAEEDGVVDAEIVDDDREASGGAA